MSLLKLFSIRVSAGIFPVHSISGWTWCAGATARCGGWLGRRQRPRCQPAACRVRRCCKRGRYLRSSIKINRIKIDFVVFCLTRALGIINPHLVISEKYFYPMFYPMNQKVIKRTWTMWNNTKKNPLTCQHSNLCQTRVNLSPIFALIIITKKIVISQKI